MDPIDSAKWSVELKITMGESIRVLHKIKIFFGFKINRFVSPNRGICRKLSAKKLLQSCRYGFRLSHVVR